MNLEQLQRDLFRAAQTPLTDEDDMRKNMSDGTLLRQIGEEIIKPNDQLTAAERLEVYSRRYWWRFLSELAKDFPGLQAVLGEERFQKMAVAYLNDSPSHSFSMRELKLRIAPWLYSHPEFTEGIEQLSHDVAVLEWAEIEVLDSLELPVFSADPAKLGEDPRFFLQPYLRLLELEYPVDELLLQVKQAEQQQAAPPLFAPHKTYVAVHRQDSSVYFKRLDREEFGLLRALEQHEHLSDAIEASVHWSDVEIEFIYDKVHRWFASWASIGWFCEERPH
jgi:hypothetical protein